MQSNFIIFLTDDQGYGDLSCMGATDFKTPHLDRMAAEGARFTDWYSNSPVCSPSRASLLTGRYPCHAGVRSILSGHRTATGLPPSVPSLATVTEGTRLPHSNVREMAFRTRRRFTSRTSRVRRLVRIHGRVHRFLLTHLLLGAGTARHRPDT